MKEKEDEYEENRQIPDLLDHRIGWVLAIMIAMALAITYRIAAPWLGWWPYT